MTTPKEALERARTAINAIVLSTHSVSFKADLDAIDEALASLQGEDAVERVAATIRQWTSHGYMQLHAGEMTAQERRTVTAVVEAIERQVRAILATGLVPDETAIRADEREKQRERDAETADCMADEYDATSFTSTNADQVAALRSKEQAAHEIAAAIRSGGGE